MYAQNERNISIKRMYEQGISVNIIATQYGISSSSVTNIAKAMGANTARAKVIETYSDEICKMYLEGLSANMIAKQFNYQFSEASVRSLLRRKNVPIRKQGVLAKCNHLCFHNIDSPTSAYLLGLFTADGNVMPKSESCHSWTVQFSLDSKDDYLVKEMSKHLGVPDGKVLYHKRIQDGRERTMAYVSVRSKQIFDDLVGYGCVPRKSEFLQSIPNLRNELLPHYIRGFFDGNGTAFINSSGYIVFGFYSTPSFVRSIYQYLCSQGIVTNGRKITDKNNVSFITFTKKDEITRFCNLIYHNADIWCERKRRILESR